MTQGSTITVERQQSLATASVPSSHSRILSDDVKTSVLWVASRYLELRMFQQLQDLSNTDCLNERDQERYIDSMFVALDFLKASLDEVRAYAAFKVCVNEYFALLYALMRSHAAVDG